MAKQVKLLHLDAFYSILKSFCRGHPCFKMTALQESDLSDQDSFSEEEFPSEQEVEVLAEPSEQEDEEFTSWGSNKRSFYNSDEDADSGTGSDAEAMLEETLKVQKKQTSLLRDEDFFPDPDSFQSLLAQNDPSSKVCNQLGQEAIEDSQQIASLLEELKEILSKINPDQSSIHSVSGGLSFFNARNSLMLNYALNVVFFLLLKAQGKKTEGHPVISHLVRTKLLLERVAPLETKLVPQTDRLIKAAAQQEANAKIQQQSLFKANLEEFIDPSESSTSEHETYKAPKIVPVRYQEQQPGAKKSKLSIRKNVLQDLHDEFNDMPEEVFDSSLLEPTSNPNSLKQKLDYEETNFTRLSSSKKEIRNAQKSRFTNELKELNSFDIGGRQKNGKRRR